MKKLELRKFERMCIEKINYIYDNATLCLDYMKPEYVNYTMTETYTCLLGKHMKYLSELKKGSIEYLYAKSCWAIDIAELKIYNTEEDFYNHLDEFHLISKEDVPSCIREALLCLNNDKKLKEMYELNTMIKDYSIGRIQYLDLYPTEIEEVSKYLAIETCEDGLKSMDLNEDTTYQVYTVKFDNGLEADIKLCSGQSNFFIDPVLFEDGHEVCVLDCEGDFYHGKEFEFEYSRFDSYTVVVNNKLRNFERALLEAVSTYGPEHIDIINEDDSKVYIAYHSENDSFMVGNEVVDYSNESNLNKIESLFESLLNLADKYDVGTFNFLFSKCL